MKCRRHRWDERVAVSEHKSERECRNGCGTVKVTRHEPQNFPPHWQEFWRGFDRVAGPDNPTPPCIEHPETQGD